MRRRPVEHGRFGAYRIEELIGRGGMGEVYRAYDTEHRRTVALKVLSAGLAGDEAYRERFRREAYAAAGLSEPHVVPIHRYGEVEGRLFLDMRLVTGVDLGHLLQTHGALHPARAVAIVGQVAKALDAAHAEGLVHRDVKPTNVLVTGEPGDEFVYLVDFGIAWSTTDALGPSLTGTGFAVGSFDYMAPERFRDRPIDTRADVYSLACVLFECLTGRRPFSGDGMATMMYAHLNIAPPAVSTLRPEVPRGLDGVVARGLAKDPERRWPTAGALAAAAREALSSAGMPPQRQTVAIQGPPPPPPQVVGMPEPVPTGNRVGPPPPVPLYGRPPGTGRRNRRWLPWTLGGSAAAVAAAVVLVVVLGRDGSPGSSTSTSSAAPTTSAAEAELRALLPPAITDCDSAAPTSAGETARLECGPSPVQPGPSTVQVARFTDTASATDAFLDLVDQRALPPLVGRDECPDPQGYLYWEDADRQTVGQVGCYTTTRGDAVLFWTQSAAQVLVVATSAGTGAQGLADLTTWWSTDRATTSFTP